MTPFHDFYNSVHLAIEPILKVESSKNMVSDVTQTCEALANEHNSWHRKRALEFRRYELLSKLQSVDYETYVATASFLSPSSIPRDQLPNVQDVTLAVPGFETRPDTQCQGGVELVSDCELPNVTVSESLLDKTMLYIFRSLVARHTGGVISEKEGLEGLLEQGRTFMTQPNQTTEAQNMMVRRTLRDLLTPFLPPFYRLFMAGIIPDAIRDLIVKLLPKDQTFLPLNTTWQLGPWFFAPFLTAFVTPPFFHFLVGPSRTNRRKDGHWGGLLVEKCQFLQESNCKGLCLHQCKLPVQQFFESELGIPLTVTPNFATQECQWNFGEYPMEPESDPSFPSGCLAGCRSRQVLAAEGKTERGRSMCN